MRVLQETCDILRKVSATQNTILSHIILNTKQDPKEHTIYKIYISGSVKSTNPAASIMQLQVNLKLQYNPQNTNSVTWNIMHLQTSHCAVGMLIHLRSTFILLFSTCTLSHESNYKVTMQYSGYARVLHCLALAGRNMGKKFLTRFSIF